MNENDSGEDVTVNLMESGDCVINHNPPGLVLLLEGKRTDLVVLQHNRCRLTVIPAIIELTLVSDGHDCKSHLIVRGTSSMFRVLVGSFIISWSSKLSAMGRSFLCGLLVVGGIGGPSMGRSIGGIVSKEGGLPSTSMSGGGPKSP